MIYFEPAVAVTFIPTPVRLCDCIFYMLRWSDSWQIKSLQRFSDKFNLKEDEFFEKRLGLMQWFRQHNMVKPFCRKFLFGIFEKPLRKLLNAIEARISRILSQRYERNEPRNTIV